MAYEVRVEPASPRILAAARAVSAPQRLSADIRSLLDQVWPVLREQGARTGHNVIIYEAGEAGTLVIEAGVEVSRGFTGRDQVRQVTTPAGEVATTVHYGDYSRLGDAYAALQQWCTANDRHPAGLNWEVYGDWDEDPAKVRTDVYFLLRPAVPRPLASNPGGRQPPTLLTATGA